MLFDVRIGRLHEALRDNASTDFQCKELVSNAKKLKISLLSLKRVITCSKATE